MSLSTPSKSRPQDTHPPTPSSFKLHLTLPISCAICLGRVRSPVVCRNLHVLCEPCIEEWIKRKAECPTCRVPITMENPCLPLIGGRLSDDDVVPASVEDNRLNLLRTRMDLLFNELENKMQTNNNTPRIAEPLQKPFTDIDNNPFTDSPQKRKRTTSTDPDDSKENPDSVKRKVKDLRHENAVLRETLFRIQEENRLLARLQMHTGYQQPSPTKTGMEVLKMRLKELEKENEGLQAALRKSDEYIEELQAKVLEDVGS